MKALRVGFLVVRLVGEAVLLVVFGAVAIPAALASRLWRRPIDVGLGPEPLINNVYHKRALARFGYSAETFVDQVYYITGDFDVRADRVLPGRLGPLRSYYLFFLTLRRYRCLYVYFNGGPLFTRPLVWRIEPFLYRLAGIRVVVMPYGSDVDEMTRSRNLLFKHAQSRDYPAHRHKRRRTAANIDLWTRRADHVISGVDWVDYLYHWDTLMLGHFSIDIDHLATLAAEAEAVEASATPGASNPRADRPLRILHAPNHRTIKGTAYFEKAVAELREEGLDVELEIVERLSNDEVHRAMIKADVVADQLVVGWYAMFALEAMSMGRPVLCYLRRDLLDLYTAVGLIDIGEVPIVNCGPLDVKDAIRGLVRDRGLLADIGSRGPAYVRKHHSLEAVGSVFDRINRGIGVEPSAESPRGSAA